MAQNEEQFLRGGVRPPGDVRRAHVDRRQVREKPLVAVLCDQADAIPALDSKLEQGDGQGVHLVHQLVESHRFFRAGVPSRKKHGIAVAADKHRPGGSGTPMVC